MPKKTFYTLDPIALAAALISASMPVSAANCSAQYCFVDGVMKWTTSQNLGIQEELLVLAISAPGGSTSSVQVGPVGNQGYTSHIVASPITRVNFSQSNRITTAWMDGSAINFTRSTKNVSIKNFSIQLQSAPNVVSIKSVLQGIEMPTFWNLTGNGDDFIKDDGEASSVVIGNGLISSTPEADGYYHAKVIVSAVGLIGEWDKQARRATNGSFAAFANSLVTGVWVGTFYSAPFGAIEVDIRFTSVK